MSLQNIISGIHLKSSKKNRIKNEESFYAVILCDFVGTPALYSQYITEQYFNRNYKFR